MRILFVTDFYHPYSGGVEIHVRTVARELADRGHQVAVATLPTPADTPERSADGAIAVYTVRHTAQVLGVRFNHRNRAWAPPFPDPVAALGLRRAIRHFEPDVIHGHDWLARSALPRLVGRRIPFVTTLHYYTRSCAKKTLWRDGAICSGPDLGKCLSCAARHYGPVRGTVVTIGLRAGTAIEDRRTARWISVSSATEHGNGLADRASSVVVANPVPSARPPAADLLGEPTGDRDPDRAVRRLPDGPFILFVGDIRPEKGLATLAAAVDILRTELGDHTPLVVVGERMDEGIGLPEGTVELGPVSNETVQRLWRRATVGVIPSRWPEPFGLVAVEAMAAGCPLVASRVGGLTEILDGGRALLVEPGEPRQLAAGLAELLADPELRAGLASAALASVERYAVQPIVDQIEQQYRAVVGRR